MKKFSKEFQNIICNGFEIEETHTFYHDLVSRFSSASPATSITTSFICIETKRMHRM